VQKGPLVAGCHLPPDIWIQCLCVRRARYGNLWQRVQCLDFLQPANLCCSNHWLVCVGGALVSWFFGFLAFIIFKYIWPVATGAPTSFALYTGMELLVSIFVFMLEGKISRQTREQVQRVDRFFAQFEDMNGKLQILIQQ